MDKDERNRLTRERRKNDPDFCARERSAKQRSVERRKKAEESGETVSDLRRSEPTDVWLRDFLRLNSEDPQIVALGKRNVRHRIEMLLAVGRRERQWVTEQTADADEAPKKIALEDEESFGAADDF
jgi:hypothetical protein